MNRFIGLIITVVAVAALVGAAIGWQFPFGGRSRSANQLETSPQDQEATQVQQNNRTRTLRANQPTTTRTAPANQTTAQAPDATVDPEATGTAQPVQSNSDQQAELESNEPVPALW
jgi:cytoskeletal protein RodZ